jgi:hypothetical protein
VTARKLLSKLKDSLEMIKYKTDIASLKLYNISSMSLIFTTWDKIFTQIAKKIPKCLRTASKNSKNKQSYTVDHRTKLGDINNSEAAMKSKTKSKSYSAGLRTILSVFI